MYQSSIYNDGVSRRALQEPPAFLILTALAADPQHGYAIMTDVAEISAGTVPPGAGTLYAALDRLAAEDLVEPDREEVVDGRLRANAAAATRRLRKTGLPAGGKA